MIFLRLFLLLFILFFSTNSLSLDELPALGDSSSSIISLQQEHQLGRAWLNVLRKHVRHLPDPQIKDFVEESVSRLSEHSRVKDRRLTFIILDNSELNAFAAPGGIIGVNAGLFLYAQTEAEYASVLSHELAHLSQRHFARGLQKQKSLQTPTIIGVLAGIAAAAAGAPDAGIAAIASTQAASIQSQISFTRQNEQEADRIGIINLAKAGYNPRAMPSMFTRLLKQYKYDHNPPEFLLTHPLSESRIADTRNRAELYPNKGKQDSLLYELMRTRVQLRYEGTSGLAVKRFRAALDRNPKNDVKRYGLAISLIQSYRFSEADKILSPLLKKAPNNIVYNLEKIRIDRLTRHFAQAQKISDQLLKQHPNNYPVLQSRTTLLIKEGRKVQAETVINQLIKHRPYDPDVWYQAAEIRGLNNNIVGLHQARAEYFALTGDYTQAIKQLDYARKIAPNNFRLISTIDQRKRELRTEKREAKELLGG